MAVGQDRAERHALVRPISAAGSPRVGVPALLRVAALFLVELVALCFPALLNRSPLIFLDTKSYYLGGHAIVVKIAGMLENLLATRGFAPASGDSSDGGSIDATVQNARAVRSVFYSLFTYGAADVVSLWLVVAVQGLLVLILLRLVFALMCPGQPRWRFTTFIALLAAATTLPWTVSFAMPDVFTPVLALSLTAATIWWERLGVGARLGILAIIAASVVMHITNLPIALGLLLIAGIVRLPALLSSARRFLMIGAALAVGAAAMLAVGVVGFHQWTLAPQSPPFLLARSIEDGPARLYLRAHCPEARLVMCQYLDRIDVNADDFIWHDNGVYAVVPPEVAAAIRQEEKHIFLAAALEHPWTQTVAIARNTLQQLGLFTLRDFEIPSSADHTPDSMTVHEGDRFPPWQVGLSILQYAAVLAGFGFAVRAWWKGGLDDDQRQFLVLILATVSLNAASGAFSLPASRYEARVIWLIPMAALLIAYRDFHRRPT